MAVANRLESIKRQAGVRDRQVADMLKASPRTVSRWYRGIEPQQESLDRLLELAWLVDRLAELYQPDEAKLWLYSRNQLLGSERPVDLIRDGRMSDVLTVISQLIDGAYA